MRGHDSLVRHNAKLESNDALCPDPFAENRCQSPLHKLEGRLGRPSSKLIEDNEAQSRRVMRAG